MAKFVFIQWLVIFISKKDFSFDWDDGNKDKNFTKHGLNQHEAEDVFRDLYLVELGIQISPVTVEDRFGVIGKTAKGKVLFISFTIRRNGMVRVISARHANKNERQLYEG